MLRCECRNTLVFKSGLGRAECVSDGIQARVEDTDNVSRISLAQDLSVAGHQLLRLGQPLDPSALDVLDVHADIVFARADADKGDPVSVGLVHIGLNLEDEGRESVFHGVHRALVRHAGRRRGRHLQEVLQKDLDTEVVERGAKKYRRQHSCPDRLDVEVRAGSVQQFHFFAQLLRRVFAQFRQDPVLVIDRDPCLRAFFGALLGVRVGDDFVVLSVKNALESLTGTDGPVHGTGVDSQVLLYIVEKVESIESVSVHLINKCKNRDVPHGTDFEELLGLGLNALGAVDDHDCGVRRHERAVGVLRKVLVSGRIEDIDAASVVFELQHRARHRDTSLFLNFHPVRDRMPGGRFSLYASREVDGSSVQKEFLCQCRLTCIGMGNDRKCAPACDFLRCC